MAVWGLAHSGSITAPAIWDHLGGFGKKSIIVGVPPNFPPRRINGISVGCFLTPDTVKANSRIHTEIKANITELVGEYPTDVKGFRTATRLAQAGNLRMSRKQWKVVKVAADRATMGLFSLRGYRLDRMHHGFLELFRQKARPVRAGQSLRAVDPEYYLWLDEQIGSMPGCLTANTVLLVRLRSRRAEVGWRLCRQRMAREGESARA